MSKQHRSYDMQSRMACLRKMHMKENPPGKEVPNNPRRQTIMEHAMKDAKGTF
jgi:hypothetical protein